MTVENELEKGELIKLDLNGYDFNMMTQGLYHKNKWLTPEMEALVKELKSIN